jgi:hypothetical protein
MKMNRRLDMIETRLNLEKELDCELEMTVGLTDNLETEASYVKLHPDGTGERINYPEAQRLMEFDTECEISVID